MTYFENNTRSGTDVDAGRLVASTSVYEPLHVLFIQTETDANIEKIGAGEYTEWVLDYSGLCPSELTVVKAADRERISLEGVDAIIAGGSGSNTNDSIDVAPWIPETRSMLRVARELGIPRNGICFSHQLITEADGGLVGKRDEGYSFGMGIIPLTDEGLEHEITRDVPLLEGRNLVVFNSYGREVKQPPPSTPDTPVRLLTPDNTMLALGEDVTMQFHPELNRRRMKALARRRVPKLLSANQPEPTEHAIAEALTAQYATIDALGELAERQGQQMGRNFVRMAGSSRRNR